jgi:hypothetical protein
MYSKFEKLKESLNQQIDIFEELNQLLQQLKESFENWTKKEEAF